MNDTNKNEQQTKLDDLKTQLAEGRKIIKAIKEKIERRKKELKNG